VQLGVHIFLTDESIAANVLARALEDRGFESLWLPEHTHIPTSRESAWLKGQDLPREYSRMLDPFVALALAATATTTLRLATGICLVAQHDPISLAKTVATLDHVSGGRVTFGVGLGWNMEEMRDHGVDPKMRRSIVREKVLAMQGLWSHDVFGFQGEYVSFEPSWSWPKPTQQPHLPVVVGGGGGPLGFKHIAEYADGWMPDLSTMRPEKLVTRLGELASACEAVGRDPGTVELTVVAAPRDPQELERLALMGATRCVFLLPSAPEGVVLSALDDLQRAVAQS
jgi:probable F420-dependent oxidoreductase